MTKRRLRSVVLTAIFAVSASALRAAVAEQFSVWGSAGPEMPPAPSGWTEAGDFPDDRFFLDGAFNIVEEDHFGIVNGRLAAAIPHRDVLAVGGLWAPPYVSSDFSLRVRVDGQAVTTTSYSWRPNEVRRRGKVSGTDVESVTVLASESPAGLLAITLRNPGATQRVIPLDFTVRGTLDVTSEWGFARPASSTATARILRPPILWFTQGAATLAVRLAEGDEFWTFSNDSGLSSLVMPPSGVTRIYLAFGIGHVRQVPGWCRTIATQPEDALAGARRSYRRQVEALFEKLPRFASSDPALEKLYYRSLVHFLTNRWNAPGFVLQPYYSTGSINGGCVCEYLWNFGETWEILPLADPAAVRAHVAQFLRTDIGEHFAFNPVTGEAFGPWYPVNQEKIIGLVYHYVKNTGDAAFLRENVAGKTILEHVIANALHRDDPSRPVALIDYGPSNSHLELRRGYPYHHVMPDLNGRRYENLVMAAALAEIAGTPMPHLARRAEELREVLKKTLWNPQTRWFDFQDDKGRKDTRYTVQVFKLFGSRVLDEEEEAGLLSHLNEKEFLSAYGLHSMAKQDVAYDAVDIDNGGGGCCTCFPPQIAERLYNAGHAAAAEDILKRILWWGERLPYWGDSLVADKIDYRKDTPLQCTIDGVTVAQCIIFGMFGVRAEFNGDVRIDPHPPPFAPRIELRGLRLLGGTFDILVRDGKYEVTVDGKSFQKGVGEAMIFSRALGTGSDGSVEGRRP